MADAGSNGKVVCSPTLAQSEKCCRDLCLGSGSTLERDRLALATAVILDMFHRSSDFAQVVIHA